MDNLISVVVPIYNVEKWLQNSIDSILGQSYKKFELILVNDGSTDNSGEICDCYAMYDSRVRVIHKDNGGLSNARNTGIEFAKGKYIVFVDPDDQVSEEYLSRLHQIAEDNKCDAVVCGYKTIPNSDYIRPTYKLGTLMTGKDLILSSQNIHSSNDLCFVWRYIYKLETINNNNIRFNEQVSIGEDVIFNLEFLLSSQRVYAISDNLYYYTVNNSDSLMRTKYKANLERSLDIQFEIRQKLSRDSNLLLFQHYRKDMASYYINSIYHLLLNNLRNSNTQGTYQEIKRIVNSRMIKESAKEIGLSYKCQNIKEYLYFLFLRFKLYPLLYFIYKKQVF